MGPHVFRVLGNKMVPFLSSVLEKREERGREGHTEGSVDKD